LYYRRWRYEYWLVVIGRLSRNWDMLLSRINSVMVFKTFWFLLETKERLGRALSRGNWRILLHGELVVTNVDCYKCSSGQ
jgi:hypothetical protein